MSLGGRLVIDLHFLFVFFLADYFLGMGFGYATQGFGIWNLGCMILVIWE
jgi:hypothetical protein